VTNKTEIKAFFGDQEYRLRLTPDLVVELERQAGAGIGALSKRVFAGQFAIRVLIEVIRLALIGGGLDPKRAKELTDTYCNRPVTDADNAMPPNSFLPNSASRLPRKYPVTSSSS
jgi:hypothetical protein